MVAKTPSSANKAAAKPAAKASKPAAAANKAPPKAPMVRLLPVLVGVAALMLSVRLHDVWLGVNDWPVFLLGSDLEAQQPPRGAGPETPPPAAPPAADAQAAAPPAAPAAPAMTPSELDVLQKLTERRKQIDAREQDVIRREELLKAANDQIDRKVAELKTLQNTIQNLLQQYNDQEDNKIKSLVKIYENMKPKEAAKIFEQLDMPILLDVVERMKEQKVSPILAEMDPSKAKNVTTEMAQRRQMPIPKTSSGG